MLTRTRTRARTRTRTRTLTLTLTRTRTRTLTLTLTLSRPLPRQEPTTQPLKQPATVWIPYALSLPLPSDLSPSAGAIAFGSPGSSSPLSFPTLQAAHRHQLCGSDRLAPSQLVLQLLRGATQSLPSESFDGVHAAEVEAFVEASLRLVARLCCPVCRWLSILRPLGCALSLSAGRGGVQSRAGGS
jgi:hypothetical protein